MAYFHIIETTNILNRYGISTFMEGTCKILAKKAENYYQNSHTSCREFELTPQYDVGSRSSIAATHRLPAHCQRPS